METLGERRRPLQGKEEGEGKRMKVNEGTPKKLQLSWLPTYFVTFLSCLL